MKRTKSIIIVLLLFISTLFCLFTGNEKGLKIPFSLAELGLIQYFISGKINLNEFTYLIYMLVIQTQLIFLLKFTSRKWRIFSPLVFIIGFLLLNFYDLDFRDWYYAICSLLPFFIFWFLLLTYKNEKNENV